MNISFLRLKNYRNISDSTIYFSQPITTFVGVNNSGKTSVLDAIFACLSQIELANAININLKNGETIIEVGFYLSNEEWVKLFRDIGYPKFFLTLEDCKQFEKYEVKKRSVWTVKNGSVQKKNELILPSLLDDGTLSKYSEHFSELQKTRSRNLASMFGVVKINPAGQQLSLFGKFIPYHSMKTEEISKQINVWFLHIKRKFPREYDQFINEVNALFPQLDSIDVLFNQDTGNVKLEIKERGTVSGINQMGYGFHSVLMLFAFLASTDFKIVIIDEPFAHMDAELIRLMVKYFEAVSEKKQIILATHNSEFIKCMPLASLFILSETKDGKFRPYGLDSPDESLKILDALGVKISDELILDLNKFENTKAAKILIEDLKPKIFDDYTPAITYFDNNVLSYFPESEISIGKLAKGSKAYELMMKLRNCPFGNEGWVEYQRISSDILSYLFSPPLSKPIKQSETKKREQRRDMIINIPFNVGNFWGWIQKEHNSIAVIVECKNSAEKISNNELTKTSKYFSKHKLGKLGFILSRKGLDDGALKEIKRLWKELEIMIIPLNDNDLINLLKIKANNGNPEMYVDEKYRKFRTSLF